MMKFPISQAGAALLRAVLTRAGATREAIRLVGYKATDWQSLTFDGERHELELRVPGPDGEVVARRLIDGLDEHEFDVNGQIVADIGGHAGVPDRSGAVDVRIEALTIAA